VNALYRLFLNAARREPRRPVLCSRPGSDWIRFGELRARAEVLASRLERAGLRRGGVALLAIGNQPAFVVAALAAWLLDACVLPVPEETSALEVQDAVRTFRPEVVLTAPRGRPAVTAVPGRGARLPGAAAIRLTSGTTGAPRGAVMSARNLIAGGQAMIARFGLRSGDVNLGVVPLNHAYGFDHLILPLVLQRTPVLLLRRPLPALILQALTSRRPMVLAAVPYLLDLLSRHPGATPRRSGLRLCLSAGAPLPRRTAEAFRDRFGVGVRTFYGTSETGGIAYDGSPGADAPEGCVGMPLPGVRVVIEGRHPDRPASSRGRVVVSGPAVGSAYFPRGSPDFANGRFRTSDHGSLDASGRLHLAGRISTMVNVSGRKVNPVEVEHALLAVDGVVDAAALGVADPLRGERLEAWVVARGSREVASIRTALAARLSPHKIPRSIHIVREIPRTPRGKLDRLRLLEGR